jgi:hypothetical protein
MAAALLELMLPLDGGDAMLMLMLLLRLLFDSCDAGDPGCG